MGKVIGKVTPPEVADLPYRGINNEAPIPGGTNARFSVPIPSASTWPIDDFSDQDIWGSIGSDWHDANPSKTAGIVTSRLNVGKRRIYVPITI